MDDPNVHRPEWEVDYRETPVRMRGVRVGAAAGAQSLGASLYEVEPGGAVAPYHLHHGNEELAIVLSGEPLLRTPAGTRRLAAGAVVSFLPGPAEGKVFPAGTDEDFLAAYERAIAADAEQDAAQP